MSTIEIRVRPNTKWRAVLLAPLALGFVYYRLGYLPLPFWIIGGALLLLIPFSLLKGNGEGPCVVLSEGGLLDRRLKVGLIRWADIRRAYRYSVQGVQYICLDLHNMEKYVARRPAWFRVLSNFQRLVGLSPIAIGTGGLDMDTETLLNRIHQGCQAAQVKR
jgi:hypothetical protein